MKAMLWPLLAAFVLLNGCGSQQSPNTNLVPVPIIEEIGTRWCEGTVVLPVSANGHGLISVADMEHVYWIPFAQNNTTRNSTVYFKLKGLTIDENRSIVYADSITTTRPADLHSSAEVVAFIRGKVFFPHDLYADHPSPGSGQHVPGHIISKVTPEVKSMITVSWQDGVVKSQTEEYTLVNFRYENNDTIQIYVRTKAIDGLTHLTNKYYPDFFSAPIGSKLVLRSYSVEHSHIGHVPTVVLTSN